MSEDWFGVEAASTYDQDNAHMFRPSVLEKTVDFLAALANGGPALEFAVGTGRVALPLAARGCPVSGIELSESMVARLRAKPGGDPDAIPVTIGDITTEQAAGAGSFSLVYLVFNTITNLTSQVAQVACFANAARHLAPGGAFVVETFIPRLQWLPPGQRYVPFHVDERHIGIDEYDVAHQALTSHHTTVRDGVAERSSVPFRYVWPSELDLMAALAGMTSKERWADWARHAFSSDCQSHVSVWEKPRS